MSYDTLMNLLLVVVYSVLAVLVIFKLFYKRLTVTVERFPMFVQLTYRQGFKKGVAKLYVSSEVHSPQITKNFTHFSFVLPIGMSYEEAVLWLGSIEIHNMYAEKGRDAFELLRAMVLYYYTRDLEQFKMFAPRCNHLRILKAIRQNRSKIKKLLTDMAKPSMIDVPVKPAMMYRR